MKNIYVAHSRGFDFRGELYGPIMTSGLSKQFNFVLPHAESEGMFNSKEFLKEKCDVLVAEVSEGSVSVGIELGWANLYGVPIVCIYKSGSEVSNSLKAVSQVFVEYTDKRELMFKLGDLLDDMFSSRIDNQLETGLMNEAMEYLKRGRPGWDMPHTFTSVYYMKELIKEEGGNEKILVSVMYLHDIGYEGLEEGYDFEDSTSAKDKHEETGAREAEKILRRLGEYSEKEINEICRLIRSHDTLDDLEEKDRQLVMEADSLAQIDWKRVKPTFDKVNVRKFLKYFKLERVPRFHTETGKKLLNCLLSDCEDYIWRD